MKTTIITWPTIGLLGFFFGLSPYELISCGFTIGLIVWTYRQYFLPPRRIKAETAKPSARPLRRVDRVFRNVSRDTGNRRAA
ncbi:MAG TPA: hypothetical protein VMB21_19730 [Candidatus Limnocylindria bacterium]|jgi:hypothetical protein|nr:hypothetical protein [Candidatus Limnocylindria bacterium]HTL66662.1 hypothetical protein [Lacunisphaera sp.]